MDRQSDLKAAKARLSEAAAACIRNEPGAAEAADRARGEVDALLAVQTQASANSCTQTLRTRAGKGLWT